ncbi:MAG: CPBP family intramembrane glutamic endopeptidase [Bacteroidota bacterium]
MKPFVRAIAFLLLLTIIDFLLRQGFILQFLPIPLPRQLTMLVVYGLFAATVWFTTKSFCKKEAKELNDLGISCNRQNRTDFYVGFLVGIGIWAGVSFIQGYMAGFSWELRPEISLFNVLYGLIFIFLADLGTELYTRGYPLTRFEDSFGSIWAIIIMTLFVGLKTFLFQPESDLLLYVILIPALHTIFFSIIYFKTRRLGAAVGVHTGANFITISIFDLRPAQSGQLIPSGIFQPDTSLESLSINALQLPYVFAAIVFSVLVYAWWAKEKLAEK